MDGRIRRLSWGSNQTRENPASPRSGNYTSRSNRGSCIASGLTFEEYLQRGKEEKKRGAYGSAFVDFFAATNLRKRSIEAWLYLGDMAKALNNTEQMDFAYRNALKGKIKSTDDHLHIALVYIRLQNYHAAEKKLLKVIKKDPKNTLAYLKLGKICFIQERYLDAKNYIQTAMDCDKENIKKNYKILHLAGKIAEELKDLNTAKKFIKQAQQLKPDSKAICSDLSRIEKKLRLEAKRKIALMSSTGKILLSFKIESELKKSKYLAMGSSKTEIHKGKFQGHSVAIKYFPDDQLDEHAAELMQQFKHEASILARLNSPYIVRLYGVSLREKAIVMEYSSIGSLYKYLRTNPSWQVKYALGLDVARGIHYLHRYAKVTHNDIKAANVLIFPNAKGPCAKLCDFGVSTLFTRSKAVLFGPKEAEGTIGWRAPETIPVNETMTVNTTESDIYSFGMLLWELSANGYAPFARYSLQALITAILKGEKEKISADTPPKMAKLIAQCWEDRNKRPKINKVIQVLEEEYATLRNKG